ncbi:hypothetical protein G9362_15780 [Bacillus sp. EKM601B]|nr:hypothetical protein B7941_17325 [Bacillus velezensis]KAF6691094.1 hypothetical protein G9362_15780 [Bacillus sp. EKM601B]MBA9148549.1 hypothetical protein [Bacillus sp. EKM213B]QBQ45795.1 hypothetical protein E3U39_14400 [Bacillus amyloliquefaciens]AWD88893.1 hypothetical protein BVQ_16160 [Bacillus velezensis]
MYKVIFVHLLIMINKLIILRNKQLEDYLLKNENLTKSVFVYSLDSSAFYNDKEEKLNQDLLQLRLYKKFLQKLAKKVAKMNDSNVTDNHLDITGKLFEEERSFKELEQSLITYIKEKGESESRLSNDIDELMACKYNKAKINRLKKITNCWINEKKDELIEEQQSFKGTRTLRGDSLKTKDGEVRSQRVISLFDSVLIRTLGLDYDQITEEIMIVESFYHNVFRSLVQNGYYFNNEKYVYYASSAGQIRQKKGVFIKEKTYLKKKNTLMCGLSEEVINSKGGMSINKWIAYLALSNSASTLWEGFNIDECIVVNDFETDVSTEVDYINDETYEIKREYKSIPINHTDGCGMILPELSESAFMFRAPFMKGMLVPFPFDEYSKLCRKTKIKDIYGKEWDIVKDGIKIILTKSQFKLWKHYDSWDDYKSKFKKYECQAAKLNEEEDEFKNSELNYQMIQTLTDTTDEELEKLSENTVKRIQTLYKDKESMLEVIGAVESNAHKNNFQKAHLIYPELLNDNHSKEIIKKNKKRLVKEAKAGKILLEGSHYTFIIPDLYAACGYWFCGDSDPKVLLNDGEVSCKLFNNQQKLDVLRPPHLSREHGIRINKLNDDLKDWFITKGVYTSTKDALSRLLQFDVDGDKALLVSNSTFVEIAERNMKNDDIVPLYYEMKTAENQEINNEIIYKSLELAFEVNIGEYSNNITKVWNSDKVDLDVIKWLTMENNFEIDYAKTLYKPTRPEHVSQRINGFLKGTYNRKVPHFFIYAKDKKRKNVRSRNDSVVNRLGEKIPNNRVNFKRLAGKFDYTKLKNKNTNLELDQEVSTRFNELYKLYSKQQKELGTKGICLQIKDELLKDYSKKKVEDTMIVTVYTMLDRNKHWKAKQQKKQNVSRQEAEWHVTKEIRETLLSIRDSSYITDILVEYLFKTKCSKHKDTLYNCFGYNIVRNLKKNIRRAIKCVDCEREIEKGTRCDKCQKERKRELDKLRKRKERKNKKCHA